jgi:cation diffusion facilitator CzcD-associated flavoprotein CzcO
VRAPAREGLPNGCWHIETAKGNTDVADVFICATGFLHQPLFPNIAGSASFAGASFHSARWNHAVPYAGKRWGVIGSCRLSFRVDRRRAANLKAGSD